MSIHKGFGYCGPQQISEDWDCVKVIKSLTALSQDEFIYLSSDRMANSDVWKVTVMDDGVHIQSKSGSNFVRHLSEFGISDVVPINKVDISVIADKFNKLCNFYEQYMYPFIELANHKGRRTISFWFNTNPVE